MFPQYSILSSSQMLLHLPGCCLKMLLFPHYLRTIKPVSLGHGPDSSFLGRSLWGSYYEVRVEDHWLLYHIFNLLTCLSLPNDSGRVVIAEIRLLTKTLSYSSYQFSRSSMELSILLSTQKISLNGLDEYIP